MNLHLARYIDRWVGLPLCFLLHGFARLRGEALPAIGATTPPVDGTLAPPHRVLAMKFYGLGNIAMILPILSELRTRFPAVQIDVLTLPGNATLLEQSGLVRRVLTTDVTTTPRFARSVLRLAAELRRGGYDTVLDFEQFLKVSGIFGFWTRAARRLGLDTEGQHRGWLYTTRIAYTDSVHTVDVFRRLTAPFGSSAAVAPWRLPVPEAARRDARAHVASNRSTAERRLVVVHVGTGPNYDKIAVKRWDIGRFADLAHALATRHDAIVAFTGQGPEEEELITEARRRMHAESVDLCDRLDVATLTGLVAEAEFVVSNDTSLVHLAGIIGTPVVALFGPTSPMLYGPRGDRDLVFYERLYCSPCISNYNLKLSRCTEPVCMRSITVDEVLAGIEASLLATPSDLAVTR